MNFNMKLVKLILCLAAAVLPGLPAPFVNGSFEAGSVPDRTLSAGDTSITGWVVLQDNVDWVSGLNYPLAASDGNYFLDLNGCCAGTGGVQQTFDSIPGEVYLVKFDMNSNNNPIFNGLFPKPMRVTAGGVSQDFVYTPTVLSGPWITHTVSFTATSGQTTLTFESLVPSSAVGPLLDKVTVTPEPVPEPSSFTLAGTFFLVGTFFLLRCQSVLKRRKVRR